MDEREFDVVVFGGGVAGLWAWAALRGVGYGAVLLESAELGGGQTLASQGILHGGQKYNLGGASDAITERLRDQPGRWREAMAGGGGASALPDLRSVRVLSDYQVMWPAGGLAAKAAAAIGVRTLEGQVEALAEGAWPEIFSVTGHRGHIYRLNETVLDVKSVVEALAGSGAGGSCYRAETERIEVEEGKVSRVVVRPVGGGEPVGLRAGAYVFAAGAGNAEATGALGFDQPATQRRPLKQVMVRGVPWTLYGHGLRASPKPRVTVTTHPHPGAFAGTGPGPDGDGNVWYLGGNVAEAAVAMDDGEAIRFAASELREVFPGVDWGGFEYAVWDIDRAEPHTPSGRLPPEPVVERRGNAVVVWPTKLVLAPALADRVVEWVDACGVERRGDPAGSPPALPPAPVGKYPWELAARWTTPALA